MRYFLYAARAARFLYIIIVLKNAKSLSGHSAAGLLYGTRFPIDCAVPYRVLGFYTERGFLYAARSDRSLRADRIRAGRTRSASIKGSGSAWAAGAAWAAWQRQKRYDDGDCVCVRLSLRPVPRRSVIPLRIRRISAYESSAEYDSARER